MKTHNPAHTFEANELVKCAKTGAVGTFIRYRSLETLVAYNGNVMFQDCVVLFEDGCSVILDSAEFSPA